MKQLAYPAFYVFVPFLLLFVPFEVDLSEFVLCLIKKKRGIYCEKNGFKIFSIGYVNGSAYVGNSADGLRGNGG